MCTTFQGLAKVFYLILCRISFCLGSIFSWSNIFFDKLNELSKAKTVFSGFKSEVTFLYAEYQIVSMSFSRSLSLYIWTVNYSFIEIYFLCSTFCLVKLLPTVKYKSSSGFQGDYLSATTKVY